MLTKSKYSIPAYGTKQFRDENNENDSAGVVINCLLIKKFIQLFISNFFLAIQNSNPANT